MVVVGGVVAHGAGLPEHVPVPGAKGVVTASTILSLVIAEELPVPMLLLMVVVVVQEGKVVIRLVSDDLEAVVSMAKAAAEGNKGR